MESSVSLQDPFSYALWPLAVAGGIVLLALVYWCGIAVRRHLTSREKKPVIKSLQPEDINRIKIKYLAELEKIGSAYEEDTLDIRHAYQKMSSCIRGFVYEMTGIKVQNYTLQDIAVLGMPSLYSLVAEYYTPEFALKTGMSDENVRASLSRTRSMIETWR